MSKIKIKSKEDYQTYLKSSHWQEIRKKVFKEYGYRCDQCGSTKNLHIHHITYENLGEEDISDLVPLCENCHKKLHDPNDSIDYLMLAEDYAYGELDSDNEEKRQRAKYLSKAISELIEAVKKIELDGEVGDIRVSFIRR